MVDRPNLPPYRFGLDPGPHPTRHPDGHSYGRDGTDDGGGDAAAFARGLELFEHGYFWEAHEAWEGAWQRQPEDAPERPFWQALILLAAARLKAARDERSAAERLAGKALDRLTRAEAAGCDRLFELDATTVRRHALAIRADGAE